MTELIVQVVTILFAIACGQHDVPAVNNFTSYGSSKNEQAKFHRWGFVAKACYIVVILLLHGWVLALICWVVSYILFDPIVALFRRERKDWWYISDNQIDGFLKRILGKKVGMWKFLIGLAFVIFMNVIGVHRSPLF
jgi:hypothetical protein